MTFFRRLICGRCGVAVLMELPDRRWSTEHKALIAFKDQTCEEHKAQEDVKWES